jgi:predicted naringenin-chalcone synthase
VLVSACLFGDGAGAAVLSNEPKPSGRQIRFLSFHSVLSPKHRELLRFEQKDGMLRNLLSPEVPGVAARHVEEVLNHTLRESAITRADFTGWILHADGRDVLLALRERLGLTADDVRWSAAILRDFGNVSSPCVYFVLEAALAEQARGSPENGVPLPVTTTAAGDSRLRL